MVSYQADPETLNMIEQSLCKPCKTSCSGSQRYRSSLILFYRDLSLPLLTSSSCIQQGYPNSFFLSLSHLIFSQLRGDIQSFMYIDKPIVSSVQSALKIPILQRQKFFFQSLDVGYFTSQKMSKSLEYIDSRGDCKPYPHNVKLVNFQEHFSQKLLDLDM